VQLVLIGSDMERDVGRTGVFAAIRQGFLNDSVRERLEIGRDVDRE